MAMWIWILDVNCILIIIITTISTFTESEAELINIFENLRSHQYKQRCTRRFTPGVCLETLNVVWQFDFQSMNCTERLGCPQSYRTNRFKTYESCFQQCRPLIDLYLQILTYGGDNETWNFLRTIAPPGPRRNYTKDQYPGLLVGARPRSDVEEYPGDEAVLARAMYAEVAAEPHDIDHVPVPRDPHDYAYIH